MAASISVSEVTFESLSARQDGLLDNLFDQAKQTAKDHLKEAFDSLNNKYQTIFKENEEKYNNKLEQERLKSNELEIKLKLAESALENNNNTIQTYKEKLAKIVCKRQIHLKSRNILTKCFQNWNKLTNKVIEERKLNIIADRIQSNFIKNRAFARFGYNMVSKNFADEKKAFMDKYNNQVAEVGLFIIIAPVLYAFLYNYYVCMSVYIVNSPV